MLNRLNFYFYRRQDVCCELLHSLSVIHGDARFVFSSQQVRWPAGVITCPTDKTRRRPPMSTLYSTMDVLLWQHLRNGTHNVMLFSSIRCGGKAASRRIIGEADDMYHTIVPWDLTLCTTAREGQGTAAF